jgi:2-methylcitrate dehydratase
MKFFPTEALTHSPLSAVLDLVSENNLKPAQIEKVRIRSTSRTADILADASKYDPHTKETADHSLPYCVAAAIVDRQVTPAQFTAARINDPQIRAQLRKVEVVADPEIEKVFPALQRVQVTITAAGGKQYSKQLDYPKGDARNPLSDGEIEGKFTALAEGVISGPQQKKVIDAVWSLEQASSVTGLMDLLKSEQPAARHA